MGGGWRYPSPSAPAPIPTQARARETVRAAIDATVELLESDAESHVTLEAIRRRSGISQGSLTHHFGSRDGLVAAAHVARYVRMCDVDRAFLEPFNGALEDPRTFIAAILDMVDDMLSEHRRAVRWARLAAIAAAFGDEELTETLSDCYTRLTSSVTTIVEAAHTSSILPPDVDARTIALLLTMHAQGLVLDDVAGVEVERSAWDHVQSRFVGAFVTPEVAALLAQEAHRRFGDLWRAEVLGEGGRVPHAVAARLDALRTRVGEDDTTSGDASHLRRLIESAVRQSAPATRVSSGSEPAEALLKATVARLRSGGSRSIDVGPLRAGVDLSPQGFHRLFGTRDVLLREARVRLEIDRAATFVARFGEHVASACTAADMRRAITGDAVRMADDGARNAMWQRIETIAAAQTDPALRTALGRVQLAARDLLIEQVCLAQRRGVMDPTLPPTGVARMLEGSAFWHVFHRLDAQRPPREVWVGMLARIAELLSPDR